MAKKILKDSNVTQKILAVSLFLAIYSTFACGPIDGVCEKWFLEKASGGIGTIWVQNEGGFHPIMRLGALFGEFGLMAVAMLGPALCLWKLISLHGYLKGSLCWLPMVIPVGTLLGNGYSGHFGVVSNLHFTFLWYGLILLTSQKQLVKADFWVLGTGVLAGGGLCGILAPFMLLKKPFKKAALLCCLLGIGTLAYLGINKITPRDCSLVSATGEAQMHRKPSFDLATYLAGVSAQAIVGPAFPKRDAVAFTGLIGNLGEADEQRYLWRISGVLGAGWLLLLFGGGWRFALGVIGCSMMTFAFSRTDLKFDLLYYPNNTQYLNWISGMLGIGTVLFITKNLAEKKAKWAVQTHHGLSSVKCQWNKSSSPEPMKTAQTIDPASGSDSL